MTQRNMFFELSGLEKILYAISMVAALCFLTGYDLVSPKDHEFLGIALVVLVLLHSVFNRAIKVGSPRAELVKGIFALLFIVATISGLMVARTGFSLPAFGLEKEARVVHQLSSAWAVVFCAAHVGMHRAQFLETARFFKHLFRPLIVCTYLVACYGLYALVTGDFLGYLFLMKHFDAATYDASVGCYTAKALSVFVLLALGVARLDLWLDSRKKA